MAYPVQTDPTAVFGRRCVAALLDAALVFIPVIMLAHARPSSTSRCRTSRSTAQEFCDTYLDEQGGFCLNAEDVDDRVYFSDEDTGCQHGPLLGRSPSCCS